MAVALFRGKKSSTGRRVAPFSRKSSHAERPLRLEPLEDRRLLSLSAANQDEAAPEAGGTLPYAVKDAVPITWNGTETYAARGAWIARFGGVSGSPGEQLQAVQGLLDGTGIELTAGEYLGMDGAVLVRGPGDLGYDQLQTALAALPGYQYVEPDLLVSTQVQRFPNDPRFNELWGLHNTGQTGGKVDADIDAPEAWSITTGSSSVVVGVIDTGVDYSHPDLAANVWTNPGEIPGNGLDDDGNGYVDDIHGYDFVSNDGDPMDDNGHGTHVSGTIAAVGDNGVGVTGINWDAQIMGLKFLDSGGYGSTSNAIRAINYAIWMHDHGVNIHLTSNSWGSYGYDQALRDAIEDSGDAGMLFVAAAGNDGNNNDGNPFYPASYDLDNIIAVAATDANDMRVNVLGWWASNYGAASVDLGAPGLYILSTLPGNNYDWYSGTSMATPHVSGVAALAWSLNPALTAAEVKADILGGVDPVADLAEITVTGGRLNAEKTLDLVGMGVRGSSPAAGEVVTTPPTDFAFDFTSPYDPLTADAGGLLVNGTPADQIAWDDPRIDADTLVFRYATSPVTAQGIQTMAMAAGAVERLSDQQPSWAWSAEFRYDAVVIEPSSTDPAIGSQVELPLTTVRVDFNEAFRADSIGADDLVLSYGAVVSAKVIDGDTAEYTLAGANREGAWSINIPAGTVLDTFGNPGAAFFAAFDMDFGQFPYPVPLGPEGPLGSLIYDPTMAGFVDPAGDTDTFSLLVDPGQTITLVVQPDSSLRPAADLFRVDDTGNTLLAHAEASAAGEDAVLQTVPTVGPLRGLGPGASMYLVRLAGADATSGAYTVQVILNAAVEEERHGGSGNDDQASAQDIGPSFIPLLRAVDGVKLDAHPERGAVLAAISAPIEQVVNGSFETGDFTGWTVATTGTPFIGWQVTGAGYGAGYSMAGTSPQHGVYDAWNGFDGAGPMQYTMFQDIAVPAGVASLLNWKDRAQWNFFASNPQPRTYQVQVRDPATNAVLGTLYSFSTPAVYGLGDTGWQTHTADLSPFAGSTVRLFFEENIPEYFTGPGQIEFDAIAIQLPTDEDWYEFTLDAGESATLAATSLTGGKNVQFELQDASGTVLATSIPGPANLGETIADFFATTGGAYYVRVSGDSGAAYSLVVTRNTEFDAEPNDDMASAQAVLSPQVAGRQWVLGHMAGGQEALYATNWQDGRVFEIDPATGAIVGALPAPPAFTPTNPFGLNLAAAEDVLEYNAGAYFGSTRVAQLDISDGTQLGSWLGVGWPYTGLAFIQGEVYAADWNLVYVFDAATGALQRTLDTLIPGMEGLTGDSANGQLFAVSQWTGLLYELDPQTGAVIRSAPDHHLGYQQGMALVGDELFVSETTGIGLSQLVNVYDKNSFAWKRTMPINVPADSMIAGLGGDGAEAPTDIYRVDLTEAQPLEVRTFTPAAKSGEFVNVLDPAVRVYDSSGRLVAQDDNSAPDRRNALVRYKVPKGGAGTYYVEVLASPLSAEPTRGEYILGIKGNQVVLPPFTGTVIDPPDGTTLRDMPETVTVDFSDNVLLTALQAADLTVNGQPAVDVDTVDGNTAVFTLPRDAFPWTDDQGVTHYYTLTGGPSNWFDAEAEAVALGGHLVAINSPGEQQFVERRFLSVRDAYAQYWTGATDEQTEAAFRWTTGEPFGYTNWNEGEPNDWGAVWGWFPYNNYIPGGGGDNYAVVNTGTLNVSTPGDYWFLIGGDDGGRLRIDGADVIVDDTLHPFDIRYAPVSLGAGDHAFEWVGFEYGGGAGWELSVWSWTASQWYLLGDTPPDNPVQLASPISVMAYYRTDGVVSGLGIVDGMVAGTIPSTTASRQIAQADLCDGEDFVMLNWGRLGAWNDAAGTWPLVGIVELPTLPAGWLVATDGAYDVRIAAGAVNDVQGTPVQAVASQFILDLTPPRVIASSVQEGDILPIEASQSTLSLAYQVTFSEPINAANLDYSDGSLFGVYEGVTYYPDSANYDPATSTLTINFSGLPDDRYQLTLFSGDGRFEDLVGWDLDGEPLAWPIPPNQSGDGGEGGDFVVNFVVDIATAVYPTPLVAKEPLGGMIYDPSFTAAIGFAGDTDSFTLDVDAGQTITVLVDPATSELQPTVELRAPGGGLLGSATAGAAGQSALLETVPATAAGTYTVTVGGEGGTMGLYTVRLTLNAALERESHGGPSNDTSATAENIDGSFLPLMKGADRGAVLGTTDATAGVDPVPEAEPNDTRLTAQNIDGARWNLDFSSNIGDYSTNTSTTIPHVTILGSGNGSYDYYSFTVPVAGSLGIFDIDFTNGWDTVLRLYNSAGTLLRTSDDSSTSYGQGGSTTSLDSFFQYTFPSAGVYVIKVSSYWDSAVYSGYSYQLQVSIRNHALASAPPDYYSFSLAAGEKATLALTALEEGNVDIRLEGPGGPVPGIPVDTNVDEVVANFVAPATGLYYARVSGAPGVDYSLVVTRDAVFDTEANNSFDTAQDLAGLGVALGSVRAGGVVDHGLDLGIFLSDWTGYAPVSELWATGRFDTITVFDVSSSTPTLSTLEAFDTALVFTNYAPYSATGLGNVLADYVDSGGHVVLATYGFSSPWNIAGRIMTPGYSPLTNRGINTDVSGSLVATVPGDPIFTGIDLGAVWYWHNWNFADPGVDAGATLLATDGAGHNMIARNAVGSVVGMNFFPESGANNQELYNLIGNALVVDLPGDEDWYSFSAVEGQSIHLLTATPADGSSEFANTLNPHIELYDPDGNFIVAGTLLADGRNEEVNYTALVDGDYRVRVTAEGGTAGEYILDPDVTVPAKQFDFGTKKSAVEPGTTAITEKSRYTAVQGYGWLGGKIQSADRRAGSPLDRDLNLTNQGTFAVDVPNGDYQVDMTLGDKGAFAHDRMGVFLEGKRVDVVTTAKRQVVSRTYDVTVADGQLTLLLKDLGGKDRNVAIAGLTVTLKSPALLPSAARDAVFGQTGSWDPRLYADLAWTQDLQPSKKKEQPLQRYLETVSAEALVRQRA